MALLDNFNRANENPLSQGGNWATLGALAAMQVFSNRAQGTSTSPNGSYRVLEGNVTDYEVQAKLVVLPNSTQEAYLWIRLQEETTSNFDGYRFAARRTSPMTMQLQRITNNAIASVIATITQDFALNDVFKLQADGTAIKAFKNGSEILSATDATYASGKIGLGASHSSAGWDDFDGAIISAPSYVFSGDGPFTLEGSGQLNYVRNVPPRSFVLAGEGPFTILGSGATPPAYVKSGDGPFTLAGSGLLNYTRPDPPVVYTLAGEGAFELSGSGTLTLSEEVFIFGGAP